MILPGAKEYPTVLALHQDHNMIPAFQKQVN